jgi:hypothetical protein
MRVHWTSLATAWTALVVTCLLVLVIAIWLKL